MYIYIYKEIVRREVETSVKNRLDMFFTDTDYHPFIRAHI